MDEKFMYKYYTAMETFWSGVGDLLGKLEYRAYRKGNGGYGRMYDSQQQKAYRKSGKYYLMAMECLDRIKS